MKLMTPSDSVNERIDRRANRIREELAQIAKQMRRWEGASLDEIVNEQEIYDAQLQERDEVVGKAIRAGLTDDPFVKAWLAEKRSLGERDDLRRFRTGLEGGVKRPISKEDFFIAYYAYSPIQDGKSAESVRRALCRQLRFDEPQSFFRLTQEEMKCLAIRLSAMPRQNFHRLLRKLNVID